MLELLTRNKEALKNLKESPMTVEGKNKFIHFFFVCFVFGLFCWGFFYALVIISKQKTNIINTKIQNKQNKNTNTNVEKVLKQGWEQRYHYLK